MTAASTGLPEGLVLGSLIGFLNPLVLRLKLFYSFQQQLLTHMALNGLQVNTTTCKTPRDTVLQGEASV